MSISDRGISLDYRLLLGIIGVLLVGVVVIVGFGVMSNSGDPGPVVNNTTPRVTDSPSSTPPVQTLTSSPGTMPPTVTTSTISEQDSEHIAPEELFTRRIEARNSEVSVIDVETTGNTIYVTARGPSAGGRAQATNDDFAEAFTDLLRGDWANDSISYGIDHAVIRLYDQDSSLFWTVRIEESWAYRYFVGDITLSKFTSFVSDSGHNHPTWINNQMYKHNISNLDDVDFVSIEQYGSTYFLVIRTSRFTGQQYRELVFNLSEAMISSKKDQSQILYLQYVIRAENGSAVVVNQINTGLGDFWREGELSLEEYKQNLIYHTFPATEIPGGIGSMTTRRNPFPARTPSG